MKTAFYYNWINLFYPHNRRYFDEVSYLEKDAYIPNYEKALNFLIANQHSPSLVFLYSVHTDHAGHSHAWMSPEYIKSIEEADQQIGNFLERLKTEDLYEDTYFIKKGMEIAEPNNTVNTASLILRLFGVKQPVSWTGEVIESVFK